MCLCRSLSLFLSLALSISLSRRSLPISAIGCWLVRLWLMMKLLIQYHTNIFGWNLSAQWKEYIIERTQQGTWNTIFFPPTFEMITLLLIFASKCVERAQETEIRIDLISLWYNRNERIFPYSHFYSGCGLCIRLSVSVNFTICFFLSLCISLSHSIALGCDNSCVSSACLFVVVYICRCLVKLDKCVS